jgi:hypothetical protein
VAAARGDRVANCERHRARTRHSLPRLIGASRRANA